MRAFGFLVNRPCAPHEVRIPGSRLAPVNQSLKRRLDDDVEEAFNRARATNDLEAATDWLGGVGKMARAALGQPWTRATDQRRGPAARARIWSG